MSATESGDARLAGRAASLLLDATAKLAEVRSERDALAAEVSALRAALEVAALLRCAAALPGVDDPTCVGTIRGYSKPTPFTSLLLTPPTVLALCEALRIAVEGLELFAAADTEWISGLAGERLAAVRELVDLGGDDGVR